MKATNNTIARKPVTREDLIDTFVQRVKENKEQETRLKQGNYFLKKLFKYNLPKIIYFYNLIVRQEYNSLRKEADKLEDHLKDIQNTGQLIGEILKQLDYEKCNYYSF